VKHFAPILFKPARAPR